VRHAHRTARMRSPRQISATQTAMWLLAAVIVAATCTPGAPQRSLQPHPGGPRVLMCIALCARQQGANMCAVAV
jgi:hypothetical protein